MPRKGAFKIVLLMYLVMAAKIVFPATSERKELTIRRIKSCKIESGYDRLTDIAKVELPRKIDFKSQTLRDYIKRGDKVEIWLGYNQTLSLEFQGYVADIKDSTPVELYCEDAMWLLKQHKVNKIYTDVSLQSLLSDILPSDTKYECKNVQLGGLELETTTAAKALAKLQDEYAIYSYFRNGKLIVNKQYPEIPSQVNIHFNKNVIDNDLVYRKKSDFKVRISAIGVDNSDERIEVSVGDEDGVDKRIYFNRVSDEEALKALAQNKIRQYQVDGYSGAVTLFGIPYIQHGYKVNLTNPLYPELTGSNYVDRYNLTFDEQGIRRVIELGEVA